MIGFHSTMDSPDSVSRVTPPSTTMINTITQQMNNQSAVLVNVLTTREYLCIYVSWYE